MTVRTGVMSDVAIQHHCPEFFPPDLSSHKAMHPLHLHTSIFRGIKVPKQAKTQTDFSRFPINDLHNFAMLTAPDRYQEATMEAVYNYREHIQGMTATPPNMHQSYAQAMKSTHLPIISTPPASVAASTHASSSTQSTTAGASTMSNASTDFADLGSLTHVPATLSLGRFKRTPAMTHFDRQFPAAMKYLMPETRAMLSNISSSAETEKLLKVVLPETPFGPRGRGAQEKRLAHDVAIARLNHEYRADRSSLNVISRAERASRYRNRDEIPEQGPGVMPFLAESTGDDAVDEYGRSTQMRGDRLA